MANPTTVVGADGIAPIDNPLSRWTTWSMDEIYKGTVGNGKYVPKVNDWIIEPATAITYIVTAVNPTTRIATYTILPPKVATTNLTQADVLFGPAGVTDQTYLAYVDATVTPNTLALDYRYVEPGSMNSYIRVFKGVDTTDTGHVVAHMYRQDGSVLTDNIPLETVASDALNVIALKRPVVAQTLEPLLDRELLTVVVYSADGNVTNKKQFLVDNTAFVQPVTYATKYITHISLESPFLSVNNANTFNIPMNVPIDAFNFVGRVHYSDGSSVTMGLGGKFKVLGMDQYVATDISETFSIVATYTLSPGEATIGAVSVDGVTVRALYTVATTAINASMSVKLFGWPVWVSSAVGYRMAFHLFNADRTIHYDVTNIVKFDPSTGAFDPKAYGVMQRKQVTVDMRSISMAYPPYIHSQIFDIVLVDVPNSRRTAWTVTPNGGTGVRMYGNKALAIIQTNAVNTVKIDNGFANITDWLNELYGLTYPLYNRLTESTYVVPTHFVLSLGNTSTTYSIQDWASALHLPFQIAQYSTLTIRFIRRVTGPDMELVATGLLVVP